MPGSLALRFAMAVSVARLPLLSLFDDSSFLGSHPAPAGPAAIRVKASRVASREVGRGLLFMGRLR
ncbi:MAG: hypothetical protein B0D82_00260 [Candidatus Sedimenticola endophacoides]|nr:MAG: hypothetical protein B0D82_00260 [Candidatus Sedimenticola endophacoides]